MHKTTGDSAQYSRDRRRQYAQRDHFHLWAFLCGGRETSERRKGDYAGAYRPDAEKLLEAMDADYIRRNCSPGVCADLLAAAVFIVFLEKISPSAR